MNQNSVIYKALLEKFILTLFAYIIVQKGQNNMSTSLAELSMDNVPMTPEQEQLFQVLWKLGVRIATIENIDEDLYNTLLLGLEGLIDEIDQRVPQEDEEEMPENVVNMFEWVAKNKPELLGRFIRPDHDDQDPFQSPNP